VTYIPSAVQRAGTVVFSIQCANDVPQNAMFSNTQRYRDASLARLFDEQIAG